MIKSELKMNNKRPLIIIAIAAVLLAGAAVLTELIYLGDFEKNQRTDRFEKILRQKEQITEKCLEDLRSVLAAGEPHGSELESNIFKTASENGIAILEYFDNRLIHWSDNSFDVPEEFDDTLYANKLLFLQNGWFIPRQISAGNEKIIGLLRLNTDYGFENDIVRNEFISEFRLPAGTQLSISGSDSQFVITDISGEFLFSLDFSNVTENTPLIILPLILWIAALFFFILGSLRLAAEWNNSKLAIAGPLFIFIVTTIIYLVFLLAGKPGIFFRTELFSPYLFSPVKFIPTLGHLLLISVLTAVNAVAIFRQKGFSSHEEPEKRYFLSISRLILMVTGALLLIWYHKLFSQLITDSNINFEPYKVLEMSLFTLVGFVSVILFVFASFVLILKAFRLNENLKIKQIVLPVVVSAAVILIRFLDNTVDGLPVLLLFLILVTAIGATVKRQSIIFNMTLVFSVILSIYSLWLITDYSSKKSDEILKVQALTYSTDNDPGAENLILNMWPLISSDSLLTEYMNKPFFEDNDFNRISLYLRDKFFNGYWENYNIRFFLCGKDESIMIDSDTEENCFTFFDGRVLKGGHQITGTQFYFIDNQGGRSYYIGRLHFPGPGNITNGLFIELFSNVNVFQPGYSELLLDRSSRGYAGLKENSFAKYINGSIVISSGEFAYNKKDDAYVDAGSDYRIFNSESFRHVLYRNGNSTVIISSPAADAGDLVISFAYLFAFIFLSANILLLFVKRPTVRGLHNLNFRQKLQGSFVGILLFSFLTVGLVVGILTVRQYNSKHYDNLKEKLNSIYLELEDKVAGEENLSADWRNTNNASLNELLINLSNIFNTDINLYDLNGSLMATSRPEIFFRDLTSRRMDIVAFINVTDLTKSEYFQTERIGNMKYLSVYVPFFNKNGKITAYLNLPYFRMQSQLTREISNLIVAVINFTLLLIVITMSIAVFISGRLTDPLSMLGEGLSSVALGKKSEHLTYRGKDEIGELVRQYNVMVDELDESARKLANSEREYAWREMARQIAHEIKNPLTPMKLNVQQLHKSWNDGIPEFGEKLGQFARNQIEYIDNLSTIATAFSSFAKLPGAKPVQVDLIEQLKMVIGLFKDDTSVTFTAEWPKETRVFVYADREHINGIFSNLFKNSIQAIPQEKHGNIRVTTEVIHNKVRITVADNGSGIPEELVNKMFTPNFTTKSSGTGLGLSIVKKYVENAGGRIWFDSVADEGASFFVELPLMYTVEKPGSSSRE